MTGDTPIFDFGEMLGYAHVRGDATCTAGWCGTSYPKPCAVDGCTGLVHANFGDENSNGDYWLYTQCDVCGESE